MKRNRYLRGEEHLYLQGFWPWTYGGTALEAAKSLAQGPDSVSRFRAGNAFSTTVALAATLGGLIASSAWFTIAQRHKLCQIPPHVGLPHECESGSVSLGTAAKKRAISSSASCSQRSAASSASDSAFVPVHPKPEKKGQPSQHASRQEPQQQEQKAKHDADTVDTEKQQEQAKKQDADTVDATEQQEQAKKQDADTVDAANQHATEQQEQAKKQDANTVDAAQQQATEQQEQAKKQDADTVDATEQQEQAQKQDANTVDAAQQQATEQQEQAKKQDADTVDAAQQQATEQQEQAKKQDADTVDATEQQEQAKKQDADTVDAAQQQATEQQEQAKKQDADTVDAAQQQATEQQEQANKQDADTVDAANQHATEQQEQAKKQDANTVDTEKQQATEQQEQAKKQDADTVDAAQQQATEQQEPENPEKVEDWLEEYMDREEKRMEELELQEQRRQKRAREQQKQQNLIMSAFGAKEDPKRQKTLESFLKPQEPPMPEPAETPQKKRKQHLTDMSESTPAQQDKQVKRLRFKQSAPDVKPPEPPQQPDMPPEKEEQVQEKPEDPEQPSGSGAVKKQKQGHNKRGDSISIYKKLEAVKKYEEMVNEHGKRKGSQLFYQLKLPGDIRKHLGDLRELLIIEILAHRLLMYKCTVHMYVYICIHWHVYIVFCIDACMYIAMLMCNKPCFQLFHLLFCTSGVYNGVMTPTKWLTSREKECWDKFVETCPNEAKKHDKVPNWARKSLGLSTSLGRVPQAFPLALQHKTDEVLLSKMAMGMEISPAGIADLIAELLKEYNAQVQDVNTEVERVRSEEGGLEEEVKHLPMPLATCSLTRGNLEKLAQRFARRFAWGYFKNEKPGRHLDLNDPAIVSIRSFITAQVKNGRVHERLIANFDQVWTLCYEPLKKIAYKDQNKRGEKGLHKKVPRKASFISSLREKAGLPPSTLGQTCIYTYICACICLLQGKTELWKKHRACCRPILGS